MEVDQPAYFETTGDYDRISIPALGLDLPVMPRRLLPPAGPGGLPTGATGAREFVAYAYTHPDRPPDQGPLVVTGELTMADGSYTARLVPAAGPGADPRALVLRVETFATDLDAPAGPVDRHLRYDGPLDHDRVVIPELGLDLPVHR
jgi:hypothetical protein